MKFVNLMTIWMDKQVKNMVTFRENIVTYEFIIKIVFFSFLCIFLHCSIQNNKVSVYIQAKSFFIIKKTKKKLCISSM